MIIVQQIVKRDGISQNCLGSSKKIILTLIQFKEVISEVDGSKIEKIFLIIFKASMEV